MPASAPGYDFRPRATPDEPRTASAGRLPTDQSARASAGQSATGPGVPDTGDIVPARHSSDRPLKMQFRRLPQSPGQAEATTQLYSTRWAVSSSDRWRAAGRYTSFLRTIVDCAVTRYIT